MAFQIGDKVGDYEIIGVLGAGGMGEVYKVRNNISDRVEAMKVLLPNLAGLPELANRFVREIKVLASLDHPNIAGLRTALRVGNQLLMIMEFVEGETLDQKLLNGPAPLADAVNFTSQVLTALSYAHVRGVIHRDIKPANMMVTPQGVLKLMDFGIARPAGDQRLTATGTTMGSLYYMSPEQIQGTALDARSDLYSVGVSLYEMVTGARPFQGDSDFSIMSAHLQANPRPPVEINARIPLALSQIILMALAKEPTKRFQTADAFRVALDSARDSLGLPPREAAAAPQPVSAPPKPEKPAGTLPSAAPAGKSHRALYMASGALAAVVVLVAGAVYMPGWLKTKGAGKAPDAQMVVEPPAASLPANTQSGVAPSSESSGPGAPAAQEKPAEVSRPAETPAAPGTPVPRPQQREARPPATASGQPSSASAPGAVSQPSAPGERVQQQAAEKPARDPALDELHRLIPKLSARAVAVRTSIEKLRAQQNAQGLSLRGDILSSLKLMEHHVDRTEAALDARDSSTAREEMDLAEREVEKLERFLGL